MQAPEKEDSTTESRRPRRTRKQVEAAITAAVIAELADVGYGRLTFEGVARRAEVSKHVLYRRHPTRPALVLAALKDTAQAVYSRPPATGTLRGDLLAWFGIARTQPVAADTFRGLVGEANEEELAHVTALLATRAHEMQRSVIEPARRRGELTGEVPPAVARLFFVLIRDRTLFGADDDKDGTWMIDQILLPLLTQYAPTQRLVSDDRKAGANG